MTYIMMIINDAFYRYAHFLFWASRLLFPLFPLVVGWFFLLRVVYHVEHNRQKKVLHGLRQGILIQTVDGEIGKVLSIFPTTIVIECDSGEKVEIFKTSVIHVCDDATS